MGRLSDIFEKKKKKEELNKKEEIPAAEVKNNHNIELPKDAAVFLHNNLDLTDRPDFAFFPVVSYKSSYPVKFINEHYGHSFNHAFNAFFSHRDPIMYYVFFCKVLISNILFYWVRYGFAQNNNDIVIKEYMFDDIVKGIEATAIPSKYFQKGETDVYLFKSMEPKTALQITEETQEWIKSTLNKPTT